MSKRGWLQIPFSQTENQRKKKILTNYWENNLLLPAYADYIPEKPCWWALFHQMGRLTEICGNTCEKNVIDANGSALQQPGILQRSLPEALSCSNTGWQKERQAVSKKDLHSATQQNFLRRWGYHVSQFLDKCLDVVGVSSPKRKLLFSSLETELLGGYCSFPKEKLSRSLLCFYYLVHVPQFLVWYNYFSKELLIHICISTYVCPSVCLKRYIYEHKHQCEVLTTLNKIFFLLFQWDLELSWIQTP